MGKQVGFLKPQIKGMGGFTPPPSKQLDRNCVPGDMVHWDTRHIHPSRKVSGDDVRLIGELKEWNSNTAIVDIGSEIITVEC
jgi:hypothetical protein